MCIRDSRWVRLQLGNGEFEGRRIVSQENLLVTRSPHTVIPSGFYGLGWLVMPHNGQSLTWHNGGTPGHTTFVGLQPEKDLGIVVLSNLGGTQMPDAIGIRFFDMVGGVEGPDYSKLFLSRHKTPTYPPVLKEGFLPEMAGRYQHPALGPIKVEANQRVIFTDTNFSALLEPIGPNLFQMRANSGWLSDIGWGRVGEALYKPPGLSEPASLTFFLGEPAEGSAFQAEKVSP